MNMLMLPFITIAPKTIGPEGEIENEWNEALKKEEKNFFGLDLVPGKGRMIRHFLDRALKKSFAKKTCSLLIELPKTLWDN